MEERTQSASSSRSTFLRNAGLVMFVATVIAFALKATVSPERLVRYTPIVIFHGIVMVGWLAFFALQASLIHGGNTRRHTANGKLSGLLVLLMVGISWWISYSLMIEIQSTTVFVANSAMLIAFLCFYTAAILAVRRKDTATHKRYMLFASLSILMPAIGRLADALTGQEALFTLIIFPIIVIALPLLYDRSLGRGVHRATVIGIIGSISWVVLMMVALSLPMDRWLL